MLIDYSATILFEPIEYRTHSEFPTRILRPSNGIKYSLDSIFISWFLIEKSEAQLSYRWGLEPTKDPLHLALGWCLLQVAWKVDGGMVWD